MTICDPYCLGYLFVLILKIQFSLIFGIPYKFDYESSFLIMLKSLVWMVKTPSFHRSCGTKNVMTFAITKAKYCSKDSNFYCSFGIKILLKKNRSSRAVRYASMCSMIRTACIQAICHAVLQYIF